MIEFGYEKSSSEGRFSAAIVLAILEIFFLNYFI